MFDRHGYLLQGKHQNGGKLGFYFTNTSKRHIDEIEFRLIWRRFGERTQDIKEVYFVSIPPGETDEFELAGGAFDLDAEPIFEESNNRESRKEFEYTEKGLAYSLKYIEKETLTKIEKYYKGGELIYTKDCKKGECD